MFNRLSKVAQNPYMYFLWALFIDVLVTRGYLYPEQRDRWVNDGLYLLGSLGIIVFTGVWLHHRLDHHKKQSLEDKKNPQTDTAVLTEATNMAFSLTKLLTVFKSLKGKMFVEKTVTTTTTEQTPTQ